MATSVGERELLLQSLRNSFIFASIPPEHLEFVLARADVLELASDTLIFSEGDPGDALYVVVEGSVVVFSTNEEGVDVALAELDAGDSFGEMALLTGEPRSASVRASQDTRVLRLMKNDFDRLLDEQPALARELLQVFGQRLQRSNLRVRRESSREQALRMFMAQSAEQDWPELVGTSREMRALRATAEEASRNDEPVLIAGERGTEKRAVAQAIHIQSRRSGGVLLGVDCTAIPAVDGAREAQADVLLNEISQDSALFGHMRGSFSFARTSRMGYLEVANNGTLVIERPERLARAVQERLREFMETGIFCPLGTSEAVRSNVRIIVAADEDLARAVEEGRFDRRLYELLAAQTVTVPPLRERKRDLPALIQHLISRHNHSYGKEVQGITADALNLIFGYEWPRNLDELDEVIRRGVSLADSDTLTGEQIFIGLAPLEETGRVNVLRLGLIRRLLESPLFPRALQYLAVAVLAACVGLALFGPLNSRNNPALVVIWSLWWPGLVLSIVFLGRFFCAVCPMGAVGSLLQRRKTLGLKIPGWLKDYGLYAAAAGFLLIIWVEQVTHMPTTARATAGLLLVILTGAVISGVLFERRAWCRYLCPLGRMIGTYAGVSPIELRSNNNICTADCKSHACYAGSETAAGCPMYQGAFSLQNNEPCILCAECVKNCTNHSVRLQLRPPGAELWELPQHSLATALFVPVLVGSALAIELRHTGLYDRLAEAIGNERLAFTVGILGTTALVGAALYLGALLLRGRGSGEVAPRFSWLAYSLLPLALAGELGHQLVPLLRGAGELIPSIGGLLGGQDWSSLGGRAAPELVHAIQVLVLVLGAALSWHVGRRLLRRRLAVEGGTVLLVQSLGVVAMFAIYVAVFLYAAT
jgi:transcriptional regulator with AAA-type ATPase domain/polyferredoxin